VRRLLHHTDPAPVLPTLTPEVSPYPISTFLSRLNVNKCAICEKDPATRVTINDELAGVTPCHMCDACFEHLHGTDEAALAAGVSIVPCVRLRCCLRSLTRAQCPRGAQLDGLPRRHGRLGKLSQALSLQSILPRMQPLLLNAENKRSKCASTGGRWTRAA
jgi:hypothetical protein